MNCFSKCFKLLKAAVRLLNQTVLLLYGNQSHENGPIAQFYKACKYQNVLSTEKYCLQKQVTSQNNIKLTLL